MDSREGAWTGAVLLVVRLAAVDDEDDDEEEKAEAGEKRERGSMWDGE